MTEYFVVKALHIIGFTCWFAGLFYVVRLFIYNVEARQREPEVRDALVDQFNTMQRRLWYGITVPAMVFTLVFGFWLLHLYQNLSGWVIAKLVLVFLLVGYHHICGVIHKQLVANRCRWSSRSLRILNEVATVFLVASVFTASLKHMMTLGLALKILGVFVLLLVVGFALYQRVRAKREAAERELNP